MGIDDRLCFQSRDGPFGQELLEVDQQFILRALLALRSNLSLLFFTLVVGLVLIYSIVFFMVLILLALQLELEVLESRAYMEHTSIPFQNTH